jgi:hypothetical protein
MPHGSNKIYSESFPNVTHKDDDRFIGEIKEGTIIGYKYFEFNGACSISIKARSTDVGEFKVLTGLDGDCVGKIKIESTDKWTAAETELPDLKGVYPVYLVYNGKGEAELLEISFK